ncbi:hypothetical protein B0A55_12720, partial [Friedmanniomyces simplex]
MSRGGRGGFGGPRHGAGMMAGVKLPFDVDPELELPSNNNTNEDGSLKKKEDDPHQKLFPPYIGGVPHAPPPTAAEKKLISIYRSLLAAKHASPAYTGPPGSLQALCGKRTAAEFNPFEDQQTYGKKYEPRPFRLADPKKRKWQAPRLFPRELWGVIGFDGDADPDAGEGEGQPVRKKIVLNRRVNLDRLARFDEDGEDGGGGEAGEEDGGEGGNGEEEGEGEGDGEAPRDDEYSEDEDDDANDYNAE